MAIEIVEEKSLRTLPEIIIDWINERESNENRRSDLEIFARLYFSAVELSFKKPEDKDIKVFSFVVRKADRYAFGTIYVQPDPADHLSENASEQNWVFSAYRSWLSETKRLADELEKEFKANIRIVVIDREPNKNFNPVPMNY